MPVTSKSVVHTFKKFTLSLTAACIFTAKQTKTSARVQLIADW